jgi:hypothetical protein
MPSSTFQGRRAGPEEVEASEPTERVAPIGAPASMLSAQYVLESCPLGIQREDFMPAVSSIAATSLLRTMHLAGGGENCLDLILFLVTLCASGRTRGGVHEDE